jgi:hypothetical protein
MLKGVPCLQENLFEILMFHLEIFEPEDSCFGDLCFHGYGNWNMVRCMSCQSSC